VLSFGGIKQLVQMVEMKVNFELLWDGTSVVIHGSDFRYLNRRLKGLNIRLG